MPTFRMRKSRLGGGKRFARDGVASCISLFPDASQLERAVWAHLCHLFQALARSSLARVLTLCLQGVRVSENPAHQFGGYCPAESGQET